MSRTDPPPFAPAFREMFADFGELMLEVQLFEVTLVGVVHAQKDLAGARDDEGYAAMVEELFRMPAGKLRRLARIEDAILAENVDRTVRLRNGLVHRWLVLAGLDLATELSTVEKERRDFRVALKSIRAVRMELERIFHAALTELHDGPAPLGDVIEGWRARHPS